MRPFDSDFMDEMETSESFGDEMGESAPFDDADAGDGFGGEGFSDGFDAGADAGLSGDEAEAMGDEALELGEEAGDEVDEMALWNAFEEEVAGGLDALADDEFFGRLLGGLGRAAGVISRGMGGAAGAARRAGAAARRAQRVAGQVGQVAGAVSPAAMAAARLASMLGAPGAAQALSQVGQVAQGVGRAAGQARTLAGSVGRMTGGAQSLLGQLSQLLAQSEGADDAFDAVVELYEDGVDAALPAAVGLAARAAARGLGFRNIGQLSLAARRALVRGVASAARELVRSRTPQAMRALPRLARSAAQVAQRQVPTPQRAVQVVRRGLPRAARQLAQNPAAVRRLAGRAPAAPLARPTDIGHGMPERSSARGRSFHINGPATLTITPR